MKQFVSLLFIFFFSACQQSTQPTVTYQNEAHRLVAESVAVTGTYDQLKSLRDVTFRFTLKGPTGKKAISLGKHIFEGERSWQQYLEYPNMDKEILQGFDGQEAWVLHDGEMITDSLKRRNARNSLKTGFYLLFMNQKLLDPGLIYRYVRKDTVNEQAYDVVEITFEDNVGDVKDIYQVYINEKTKLIDQYLLTIMAYGVTEPELVRRTHETFGPIMIPTYQKYTKSNWEGEVLEDEWTEEVWEELKFNQGVRIESISQIATQQ